MTFSAASFHSARTRCFGISHVSRTSGSVSVSSPRPNLADWPRPRSLRAFAGVTGNLTCPKPSTSRLKSSVFAVSSTLNAACASPRSVLASRSRAAVAMALVLPYPLKRSYL